MKTVLVSGGIDPIHCGHLRMIQEAAQYGNVIVALNSDAWLMRKKGYVFMPWEERKELLEGYSDVWKVVSVDDSDGTVCEAIRTYKPDYFANGGDRTSTNTPEKQVCEELGIGMLWNVGGGKFNSSSDLVVKAHRNLTTLDMGLEQEQIDWAKMNGSAADAIYRSRFGGR